MNKNDDTRLHAVAIRRQLRRQSTTGAKAALAELCVEQLNEDRAAVMDRENFCRQVGARLLRRLGL